MTTSSHAKNSQSADSGKKPLYYSDDPDYVRELIWDLINRKRYVRRESKHHFKVREVNYWPSTGTISIDGEGRYAEKGSQALMKLLDQKYPKRHGKDGDAEAVLPEPAPQAPKSPAIFELNLDDLDMTGDYDPVPSDVWDWDEKLQ